MPESSMMNFLRHLQVHTASYRDEGSIQAKPTPEPPGHDTFGTWIGTTAPCLPTCILQTYLHTHTACRHVRTRRRLALAPVALAHAQGNLKPEVQQELMLVQRAISLDVIGICHRST